MRINLFTLLFFLSTTTTLTQAESWSGELIRAGLSKVGFNSTSVDRILADKARAPNPFVYDLTDENYHQYLYERIIPNASDPLSSKTFGIDDVFVITVYAQDAVSDLFVDASDAVAQFNSSSADGSIQNMHFSRIDYNTQTILPTIFWLWKVPVIVIATNNMHDLRFFKIGSISPYHLQMAQLLADRSWWERKPIWTGRLAPGGDWETYKLKLAKGWAYLHSSSSKIPNFVLLILSGALVNVLIGFFHKDPKPPVVVPIRKNDARHEERQALKRRLIAAEQARVSELENKKEL